MNEENSTNKRVNINVYTKQINTVIECIPLYYFIEFNLYQRIV